MLPEKRIIPSIDELKERGPEVGDRFEIDDWDADYWFTITKIQDGVVTIECCRSKLLYSAGFNPPREEYLPEFTTSVENLVIGRAMLSPEIDSENRPGAWGLINNKLLECTPACLARIEEIGKMDKDGHDCGQAHLELAIEEARVAASEQVPGLTE